MKIGVISDTHGDHRALEKAVSRTGVVDLWLHAGDLSQDGRILGELCGLPVVSVAGNCDGRTEAKLDEFIEVAGSRLWLTHGHHYEVRHGNTHLKFWARRYEIQVVIYGHTHLPDIHWDQDLLLFNPGSASQPRGGFSASCGLLTISDAGQIMPVIIEL
jgi:putative phosphoesterase